MKRRESLSWLVLALLGPVGCSKPKPPTLRARAARVTGASRYRVELSVQLDAHNPKAFPLVLDHVSAKCEQPDGTLLGTASATPALTIPANADQLLEVKLNVELERQNVVPPFGFKPKPMAYRLRGTARVGGDGSSTEVPFLVDGVLAHDELMKTVLVGGGIK